MSSVIVIGIDDSPEAARVAAAAARLTRALGCSAALVNVAPDWAAAGRSWLPSISDARRLRRLRALKERYGFPERSTVHIPSGEPAAEIVRAVQASDAELVVLGSHGLSEIGGALHGSVSADLMRQAPCPVVVVPPAAVDHAPEERIPAVICGVESPGDERVLRLGADLARRLAAMLFAVHAVQSPAPGADPASMTSALVFDPKEVAEAALDRAFDESGVEAFPCYAPAPAADALERLAAERASGLIVVGFGERGKLGSILHGSVAIQLAADSPVPVVVIPPEAVLAAGSGHYELVA